VATASALARVRTGVCEDEERRDARLRRGEERAEHASAGGGGRRGRVLLEGVAKLGLQEEGEGALSGEHRRIVQPDEADVGAELEAGVEPDAGEAAGEDVEVASRIVVEPVVESEGDGERQRVEQQHGGEEDRDRDRERRARVLELPRERAQREEAAVQPEDP
jgi:hypothetical protein